MSLNVFQRTVSVRGPISFAGKSPIRTSDIQRFPAESIGQSRWFALNLLDFIELH